MYHVSVQGVDERMVNVHYCYYYYYYYYQGSHYARMCGPLRTRTERNALNLNIEGPTGRTKKKLPVPQKKSVTVRMSHRT